MGKTFYIFGSGNHANVVKSELCSQGNLFKKFIVLEKNEKKDQITLDEISFDDLENLNAIIGVGDPNLRHTILNNLKKDILNKINWISCISRSAHIQNDVIIGDGVCVLGTTTINTGTNISDHAIINTNCSIDHDCSISKFSNLSPNSTLAGNVRIGERTFIGAGTIIKNNIDVGSNCLIGAGSLVIRDIGSHSHGYGSPFRKTSVRKDQDSFRI